VAGIVRGESMKLGLGCLKGGTRGIFTPRNILKNGREEPSQRNLKGKEKRDGGKFLRAEGGTGIGPCLGEEDRGPWGNSCSLGTKGRR